MSHHSIIRKIIRKIIGYPSFVRRLQELVITRMLDLNKKDLLLDVGCGEGYYVNRLAKMCRYRY